MILYVVCCNDSSVVGRLVVERAPNFGVSCGVNIESKKEVIQTYLKSRICGSGSCTS